MSYVMLYPVLFMLSSGFQSINDVYDPTVVWVPHEGSLQPLQLAVEVMDYWNAITKTLTMVFPSVILELLCSLLAGYGFARFRFRGKHCSRRCRWRGCAQRLLAEVAERGVRQRCGIRHHSVVFGGPCPLAVGRLLSVAG